MATEVFTAQVDLPVTLEWDKDHTSVEFRAVEPTGGRFHGRIQRTGDRWDLALWVGSNPLPTVLRNTTVTRSDGVADKVLPMLRSALIEAVRGRIAQATAQARRRVGT